MATYLQVSATTNSEWDSTNFLLVELRPELLKNIKDKIDLIKRLNESDGISTITIDSDNADFFDSDEDVESDYAVLELDSIDDIDRPEQTLRYGHMSFSPYSVTFVSYGKHTGEEFSGSVPNQFLLNLEV